MDYLITDLAYLAGIIDGEGSVSIHLGLAKKKYPVYIAQVVVVNSDVGLLDWIYSRFGGMIHKKPTPKSGWATKRQCYTWTLTGYALDRVLSLVSPYMIVKKQQVDIVIAFRKTFGPMHKGNKLPTDIAELRKSYCDTVKRLNAPPAPSVPLPLVTPATTR